MEKPEQDPRVYFAAERTFLAWIRTGLGLMGIGFAVSRFGLFLREMSARPTHVSPRTQSISLWSGVALVGLGVLVNANAVWQHLETVRQLNSGRWLPGQVSKSAIALGLVLAVGGLAMAVYLVLVP